MSDTPITDAMPSRIEWFGTEFGEVEVVRKSDAEKLELQLAEVTKQRDHLAALLRRAKIYVHTCPFKREIIDALQDVPASQGGEG